MIDIFLAEGFENLQAVRAEIEALDQAKAPGRESLDKLFRAVHCLRGASGSLEFHRLGKLAHACEELLAGMRSGQVPPNVNVLTALRTVFRTFHDMLAEIKKLKREGDRDRSPLMKELMALSLGAKSGANSGMGSSWAIAQAPVVSAPAAPAAPASSPLATVASVGRQSSGSSVADGSLVVRLTKVGEETASLATEIRGLAQQIQDPRLQALVQKAERITQALTSEVLQLRR